jgi:hypothetical protein
VCFAGAVARGGVGSPWASQVVSYTSGVLPPEHATYINPATALGEPERFTGEGQFPGAVTPFNPAYLDNEIVSIGVGGSLTLRFDHAVQNDPNNPFGVDLLVFGNTGYISDLGYGVTSGATFGDSTQGRIEVSADGVSWHTVVGVQPDGLFPTLGYRDVSDPFTSPPGTQPTDFTKPVNPAFDASGRSLSQIIAAYDGSGGGAGVDLASLGLSQISFVRVSFLGSTGDLQIDAVSDVAPVPGPGALGSFAVVGLAAARWRRRDAARAGRPAARG